ncbi:testis-specific serine/threonine-protein kinase 6-like [Bradysia coprophila]|uniref:testis-specific serine/threonine-protein kinase 6-like n=1 Tax=Bradysia coprophila TaxID=38358 RepID=UPI00187DA379|nr:testis-specific serine/threonine-protein kinase 6-like [Bradysia coprophila]
MPKTSHRIHLTESEENALSARGYELSTKLGEGAYAKVYVSVYKRSAETLKLACKIIDERKTTKSYVGKFLPRELDCLMKLKHPHIVHVHSIFRRNFKYFIFMRYAENGDLMDFIVQFGALTEVQARFWARQISLAVQYLHTLGITHRDIKCENVLITNNNNVKLTDFGFSRYILDANSKEVLSETYCGSLLYTAPEVLRGIPYEPTKADIWALGVLIFTMLNKCVPFDNSNVTILYQHQIKRRYKFRERVCGSVSIEVKKLIRNLLEPIPKRRLNIHEVVDNPWYEMDPRFAKLSDSEAAALEEARKTDMRAMKSNVIEGDMNDALGEIEKDIELNTDEVSEKLAEVNAEEKPKKPSASKE